MFYINVRNFHVVTKQNAFPFIQNFSSIRSSVRSSTMGLLRRHERAAKNVGAVLDVIITSKRHRDHLN